MSSRGDKDSRARARVGSWPIGARKKERHILPGRAVEGLPAILKEERGSAWMCRMLKWAASLEGLWEHFSELQVHMNLPGWNVPSLSRPVGS